MMTFDLIFTVIFFGCILYICGNTTVTINKTEKPKDDKVEKISSQIITLEKKLEHVETIHGYTSVTSLLRYEIEQLKNRLSKLQS